MMLMAFFRAATMENRPKSAHRYNVQEQQDVYKEEIVRIWRTQQNSLSSPIEPELTQEDEDRFRGRGKFKRADTPDSNAGTPRGQTPGSRASSPVDDAASNASGGRAGGQNKVLRIKRLVRCVFIFRFASVTHQLVRGIGRWKVGS